MPQGASVFIARVSLRASEREVDRLVAHATMRGAARVATIIAVTMLAFVGTFALPRMI